MLGAADRAALKGQLIAHEGRRTFPYQDVKGNWTIGIGHNLTANGLPEAIVDALYEWDLARLIDGIDEALPWASVLPPAKYRVLVDIAFNCGVLGLLKFQRMLEALQRGDSRTAALEVVNSQLAPARAARLAALLEGSGL